MLICASVTLIWSTIANFCAKQQSADFHTKFQVSNGKGRVAAADDREERSIRRSRGVEQQQRINSRRTHSRDEPGALHWNGGRRPAGTDLGLSIGAKEVGQQGSCGWRRRTSEPRRRVREVRTVEGDSKGAEADGGEEQWRKTMIPATSIFSNWGLVSYFSSFSPGRRNPPATNIVAQREYKVSTTLY